MNFISIKFSGEDVAINMEHVAAIQVLHEAVKHANGTSFALVFYSKIGDEFIIDDKIMHTCYFETLQKAQDALEIILRNHTVAHIGYEPVIPPRPTTTRPQPEPG